MFFRITKRYRRGPRFVIRAMKKDGTLHKEAERWTVSPRGGGLLGASALGGVEWGRFFCLGAGELWRCGGHRLLTSPVRVLGESDVLIPCTIAIRIHLQVRGFKVISGSEALKAFCIREARP